MKIKREIKKIPLLLVFLFSAMLAALPATPVRAEGTTVLPGLANWFVEGSGTYFEMPSSQYLNVTLTSSETVHMILESAPRMVSFFIESNSSATSTLLTLSGFETNATYYRHQDGYLMEEFTTDSNGGHAYTQNISEPHHVYIQEHTSTLYIADDYTFTSDIYESIVVVADFVEIDGNGYTLQGPGSGYGFYLSHRIGVTITNVVVKGWSEAVRMCASSHNLVTANTFQGNSFGITLLAGPIECCGDTTANTISDNYVYDGTAGIVSWGWKPHGFVVTENIITGNTVTTNWLGIQLMGGDYNLVSNNTFANNYLEYGAGIMLAHWDPTGNIVRDNLVFGNYYGIYLGLAYQNTIYHNNIIENVNQAYDAHPGMNDWHHPELLEGNYWSDYPGIDDGSGTGKHAIAGDDIGDTYIPWPGPDYDYYPFTIPMDTTPMDITPPVTTISLSGTLGLEGWYVSDVIVALTATDDIFGVAETAYRFDGATWITYTEPFTITTEGITTVYYNSTDNAGNVEATKSQTIKIDKTPPEITITSPEPRDYLDTEILHINYSATDAASGIASLNATLGYDPAIMYFEPTFVGVEMGETFTVTVMAKDFVDLFCWGVEITFDPSVLNCLDSRLGATLDGDVFDVLAPGVMTIWLAGGIDNDEGVVSLSAVTLVGPPEGVTGEPDVGYKLIEYDFLGVGVGCSPIHLNKPDYCTCLLDPSMGIIPCTYLDGTACMAALPEEHDMAITSVTAFPSKVTAGELVTVIVVVENQGTRTETFNVTVFYDSTQIATETDITLGWGFNKTLTFTWDTTGIGRPGAYTISAEVSVVPGETEWVDNALVDGVVAMRIPVSSCQEFDLSSWRLGEYTLSVTAVDNAGNVVYCTDCVRFSVVTTLSGVVTDEYTKEPIPGVTISVLETGESVVTDEYGGYSFAIRAVGIYTVEMTVPYGYLTHDDVTKFVEVIKATEVNFTLYQASWSGATVPRTIGYWKNWDNHYTREMMETFVAHVKSASGLFSDLTVDDVKSYLKMGRFGMERKGQTQLLASWLNVVSAQLGVDVQVDLSPIEGWEQVITIPDGSVLTVDELLRQIDNLYLDDAVLSKEQWEIVKDILDALNNGQLFVEE